MYRIFWSLWEKARVGWFERIALKRVYYHMWNRSPVQVWRMRQGAQGWCTRDDPEGWDGEGGGRGVCRYDCGTAMAKPKENIGLAGISDLGGITELKPGLLLLWEIKHIRYHTALSLLTTLFRKEKPPRARHPHIAKGPQAFMPMLLNNNLVFNPPILFLFCIF